MGKRISSRQQGFSLVELVIGMAIFLLVLLAIYQLFDTGSATYRSGQRKADVQQNVRVALDEMVRQLRVAGYFPEQYDANPGNDLVSPQRIHVAASNGLAVFGDLDGSGGSKVSLYCLTGSTIIRKQTAGAAAADYTCSGGDILADNITSLTFTFYDGNNTLLAGPLDGQALNNLPTFTNVTNRTALRTVLITLTATEVIPRQPSQIYTLTSSIALRNLN